LAQNRRRIIESSSPIRAAGDLGQARHQIRLPVLRIITESPASAPASPANASGPSERMARSAASAAVMAKAMKGTSLKIEPLNKRKWGSNVHNATITRAGQSPMPLRLRSTSNVAAKNQRLKNAVTQTPKEMFVGKDGFHFQTPESSHGYSTGYFVWGGLPGRLGIT